jgi:glycosyltransferase involved in cell wall biosynthesis
MAHFQHPKVKALNDAFFATEHLEFKLFKGFTTIRDILVNQLRAFIDTFRIDTLVVENALSIPMNIPLAMALTEVIRETDLPTIAHHHDFSWERRRFLVNGSSQLVQKHFPPDLPSIQHVVINSDAKKALREKTGIASHIVPNVMDFESAHDGNTSGTHRFLEKLRLVPRDRIVLQPTRIVPRKGIELAIDLVHGLADDRVKLVISHPSGDEGDGYCRKILKYAEKKRVDLRMVDFDIGSPWSGRHPEHPHLSLWDVYPAAELVTLPSLVEGFGNAFLEAIWFRKPIMVNRYDVYLQDIKPIGFACVEIDGAVTPRTIQQVKTLLDTPESTQAMVAKNYALAERHFSYGELRERLHEITAPLCSLQNRSCAPRTGAPSEAHGRVARVGA